MSDNLSDLVKAAAITVREVRDFAIFVLDPTGVIRSWNEGAALISGYSAEEVIGKHLAIFYTPEDMESQLPKREMELATKVGRSENQSWRVRRDGTRFWADEIMTALHNEQGRLRGFLKITRDLTERWRVQDALRESEERYRTVVQSVKDYAIITVDSNRCITHWNNAARMMIGYEEQEIVGQSADVIFTSEDRQRGAPQMEMDHALKEGRAEDERWHVRKNGSRFWGSGVMTAMRDEGGRRIGFSKILRDETERKRMEDERARLLVREQAARETAEEATRLKDEFLAVVSHELRTPLAAILLWTKLLRAGMLDERSRGEAAGVIEQSAHAQRALVEDLLDVSRILSGRMRLNAAPSDVAAVVRAAIDAVQPMADAKSLRIVAELDPAIGQVRIDADRMQQVVWNLLTNAAKFTPAGGSIAVSLKREDKQLIIRVSDTGQGISPEFLPHVFDRFRQADASTTRLEGGLGLGLTITKQLVELHGGTIQAESDGLGKGATFTVRIPLMEHLPAIRGSEDAASSAAFVPSHVLQGTWVLLVEDDDSTRTAVTWLLERSGAEVTSLPEAEAAIRGLAADMLGKRPDVLVADIAMPGEDGFTLLRRLRTIETERGLPPLPAAALTAYARDEDRRRALDAGFDAFIAKPFEPNELIQVITRLAAKKRA